MKIYADIRREVDIDPKDVIEKLMHGVIGSGWVSENDGKYYHNYEVSAGPHSIDRKEEISKETYDYVRALELVMDRIICSES